jgi:hypothetical protein
MAGEETEARRERVRSLWVRSDKDIAQILTEEGFGGPPKKTADGKRTALASMQRNVWNDRKWWREKWRNVKTSTTEDAHETRGEYLATLDSYRGIGLEIATNPKEKGTPRTQALMALARIGEAKAKAQGVAEVEALPPEDDERSVPFNGIVVGLANLSPEAQRRIDEWNSKRRRLG